MEENGGMDRHNEGRRQWLQQHEALYLQTVERIKEEVPVTLVKIAQMLSMVKSDDPPQKSHWVVAQCRVLLEKFASDSNLVNDYERNKKAVLDYDMRKAKQ